MHTTCLEDKKEQNRQVQRAQQVRLHGQAPAMGKPSCRLWGLRVGTVFQTEN